MNPAVYFFLFGVPPLIAAMGWGLIRWNRYTLNREAAGEKPAEVADSALVVEQHAREVIIRVRGGRSQGHVLS
jgi:hypothetical protein